MKKARGRTQVSKGSTIEFMRRKGRVFQFTSLEVKRRAAVIHEVKQTEIDPVLTLLFYLYIVFSIFVIDEGSN